MLFDLDKSGKNLKKCTSRFFTWKVTVAYHMKHKLHQLLWACFKGKTGGGGKIASPTELPCLFHFFELQPLNLMCFFIIIIIIMWSIYSDVFLAVHIRALPLDLCVWKSPLRRIPTLADRWRGCVDCLVQHSLGTRTIRLGWSPEAKGFDERFLWGSRFVRGHHRSSWTRDGKRRPCWLKGAEETCSEPSCVLRSELGCVYDLSQPLTLQK